MNIRLLTEFEIEQALNLATKIFEKDVLPYLYDNINEHEFREYVDQSSIIQGMKENCISPWGVFENDELCGMGILEFSELITMLYIDSSYQGRGYGTSLLKEMEIFASNHSKYKELSIDVIPIRATSFFAKRGFIKDELASTNHYCTMTFSLFDEFGNSRIGFYQCTPLTATNTTSWPIQNHQPDQCYANNQSFIAYQNLQPNQTNQNYMYDSNYQMNTTKKQTNALPYIVIALLIIAFVSALFLGTYLFVQSNFISNLQEISEKKASYEEEITSKESSSRKADASSEESSHSKHDASSKESSHSKHDASSKDSLLNDNDSVETQDETQDDMITLPNNLGRTIIFPEDEIQITATNYSIEEQTITMNQEDDSVKYDFDIHYPQVVFTNNTNIDKINQVLEEVACYNYQKMYPVADLNYNYIPENQTPHYLTNVSYEITYMTNDLLSVSFEDHYYRGSIWAEFVDLRTVIFNMHTGETYNISDLITCDQDLTNSYYKKIADEDEDFKDAPDFKKVIVQKTLLGECPDNKYYSNITLGKNGFDINFTYHYYDGKLMMRGWVSTFFTHKELENYHTDNEFWNLYN